MEKHITADSNKAVKFLNDKLIFKFKKLIKTTNYNTVLTIISF